MSRVLEKYLATYAEPLADQLKSLTGQWTNVLVVPAYNEHFEDLWSLWQDCRAFNCLFILVINQPENEQQNPHNNRAAKEIAKRLPASWKNSSEQLRLAEDSDSALLLVDCYTEHRKLPAHQGVGLARKIGADIACALFQQGRVLQPWIFSTDADVSLPTEYLRCTLGISGKAAMILLPFIHKRVGDGDLDLAQRLYTLHLQYYVDGLRWANSPYAYHTMGSAQIISIEHYCAVRGYPKRSAGEDFYLLNKLAKTGEIVELDQPEIVINTRRSQRTPFGTGAAVATIMAFGNPVNEYPYYNPGIFSELRSVLASFKHQYEAGSAQALSPEANDVLATLQFNTALQKARRNSRSNAAFCRHLNNWFDAFRTLKFVHLMRDKYYPSVHLQELSTLVPEGLLSSPKQLQELL